MDEKNYFNAEICELYHRLGKAAKPNGKGFIAVEGVQVCYQNNTVSIYASPNPTRANVYGLFKNIADEYAENEINVFETVPENLKSPRVKMQFNHCMDELQITKEVIKGLFAMR